jgi:hypothetical protein
VLSHTPQQGDGVRGRVVSSRSGVVGAWDAHHAEVATAPAQIAVEAGDTVDFVTDCRSTIDFDQFDWTVTMRLTSSDGGPQVWDSVSGFHGPVHLPLSRWEQFAQVLFMSNEFMFVD